MSVTLCLYTEFSCFGALMGFPPSVFQLLPTQLLRVTTLKKTYRPSTDNKPNPLCSHLLAHSKVWGARLGEWAIMPPLSTTLVPERSQGSSHVCWVQELIYRPAAVERFAAKLGCQSYYQEYQ